MPEDTSGSEEAEVPEMTFELKGFTTMSHNLIAGGSSSTQARLLDKDLQWYESRANAYCIKYMKEARLSLPPGSKPVLDPPDPLTFWNIQVCILIELSLPIYMSCSLG